MVWLNNQHFNYPAPEGHFGGAMCMCPDCRNGRRNHQTYGPLPQIFKIEKPLSEADIAGLKNAIQELRPVKKPRFKSRTGRHHTVEGRGRCR